VEAGARLRSPQMIEKVGGRDRDRTGAPCLQSRRGNILAALSGVAYTQTDKNSRSLKCPEVVTRNHHAHESPNSFKYPSILLPTFVDRSGTFSIDLFDGSARGEHVHDLCQGSDSCWTFEGRRNLDDRETVRA
jgi:hypothetical protein